MIIFENSRYALLKFQSEFNYLRFYNKKKNPGFRFSKSCVKNILCFFFFSVIKMEDGILFVGNYFKSPVCKGKSKRSLKSGTSH